MTRKTKTDVVEIQAQSHEVSESKNWIQLAIKNNASIDTIERLMALYERERAEQARKEFFAALSEFQAEVPPIKHNKEGYEKRYSYADLDQIIKTIKKPLRDYGFTYRFEFRDVKKDNHSITIESILEAARTFNWEKKKLSALEGILRDIMSTKDIEVTCIITHKEGHSERTIMIGPEDYSGSKNSIQARGSSTTYLERYALIGALGLVTADADNDGGKPNQSKTELVNDKRQTASGERWEYIKGRISKGEVSLETAKTHFKFNDDQLKELESISLGLQNKEAEQTESEIKQTVDADTFKEMCKDVLNGTVKIQDLGRFSFSSDQMKSLQLMQQQAEKKK